MNETEKAIVTLLYRKHGMTAREIRRTLRLRRVRKHLASLIGRGWVDTTYGMDDSTLYFIPDDARGSARMVHQL